MLPVPRRLVFVLVAVILLFLLFDRINVETPSILHTPVEYDSTSPPSKVDVLLSDSDSAPVDDLGGTATPSNPTWKTVPVHYPVKNLAKVPSGPALAIPRIELDFAAPESSEARAIRLQRLEKIKGAFAHAWAGYRDKAWLKDEVMPISGKWNNRFSGFAATLVDSLDTMWIMGMKEEFHEAAQAVKEINFTQSDDEVINVFETTIRYLGGFLAAYDMSGEKILLDKARELGDMLIVSFDTENRLPISRWKWRDALMGRKQVPPESTLSAEIGSLSLEFTRLSQLTGDMRFYDAITRVTNMLEAQQMKTKLPGLWSISLNTRTADFTVGTQFSIGAMADSLYEYLPKQFLLTGGHETIYKKMYINVIEAAKKHLFFKPMTPNDESIIISGVTMDAKSAPRAEGQHLVCFAAGMVAMGAKIFDRPAELKIGRQLLDGCLWTYRSMPSLIGPETFTTIKCPNIDGACPWSEKQWLSHVPGHTLEDAQRMLLPPGFTSIPDARYILRPETIESVFILYRITGDPDLLEQGWRMFEAIDKATRTEIAHAALSDVKQTVPPKVDSMESFWLGETMKYFYLLFEDPRDRGKNAQGAGINLDEWVFNTEAHPMLRMK